MAGEDTGWWPYAALVGIDAVKIHLAGLEIPEPREPFRAGHDAHVWITNRTAVCMSRCPDVQPVILGYLHQGVVIIDIARAPGPIALVGEPDQAAVVHRLLAAQLPREALVTADVDSAHWPVVVDADGTISLIGAAVAVALPGGLARRAAALARKVSVAAAEPARAPAPADALDAAAREADDLVRWEQQLAKTVAEPRPTPTPAPRPTPGPAPRPTPTPTPRPAPRPTPAPAPAPRRAPGSAPGPTPASKSARAVAARPDEWADFAVSSATNDHGDP
jgi:hypothetical protein